MTTTLIVLVLLALGVGIVIWAARRKPSGGSAPLPDDGDTAWNDPMTRADAPPTDAPAPADDAALRPGEGPRV